MLYEYHYSSSVTSVTFRNEQTPLVVPVQWIVPPYLYVPYLHLTPMLQLPLEPSLCSPSPAQLRSCLVSKVRQEDINLPIPKLYLVHNISDQCRICSYKVPLGHCRTCRATVRHRHNQSSQQQCTYMLPVRYPPPNFLSSAVYS